ncbi:MAG: TOBE domain-containing protein, partial [Rubrivivax sp.]
AGFMGEALLFDAQVLAGGTVQVGSLRLPLPEGREWPPAGPVKLAVRPEAWHIMPGSVAPGAESHPAGCLPGRLLKQAYLGHSHELTVATDLGDIFVVSPQAHQRWEVGQPVWLQLSAQRISVVPASPQALVR